MHVSFIKFPEDIEAQKEWVRKEARRRLLENNFVAPMCVNSINMSMPKKDYNELIEVVNNVVNDTYFHAGEVR